MKRIIALILASLLPALAVGEGVSAMKSAAGVLIVWDVPDPRFTVEIPGAKIEPVEHPGHFFIKVDGIVFQVQVAPREKIFGKPVDVSPKGLLLAHRDWEEKHIEQVLKAQVTTESAFASLPDGTDALSWSYAMPKGMDTEISRQIYVTRAVGNQVIVLNASVPQKSKDEAIRNSLMVAAKSFRSHDAPIDLAKLQESMKNPAAKESPAASGEKPSAGDYNFHLTRFDSITFTVTRDGARVVLVTGNKQGEEIAWKATLTPKEPGVWTLPGGSKFTLERLAEKIVNDSNRGINSGHWKLTLSGEGPEYATLKKKIPAPAFSGTGKTEYIGEKAE